METVCIIDVETTGLDPDVHEVVEVGAVLWSVTHGTEIASFSTLVQSDQPPHPVTRLPFVDPSLLPTRKSAIDKLAYFATRGDILIAHNASFDRSFLPELDGLRWVCSRLHIEWPRKSRDRTLVQLAVAHDVPVVSAHRALDDCRLVARLLEACWPVSGLLEDALLPRVKVAAAVSYDDRKLAKNAGFQWDPEARVWWHEVREDRVRDLPFEVQVIA